LSFIAVSYPFFSLDIFLFSYFYLFIESPVVELECWRWGEKVFDSLRKQEIRAEGNKPFVITISIQSF